MERPNPFTGGAAKAAAPPTCILSPWTTPTVGREASIWEVSLGEEAVETTVDGDALPRRESVGWELPCCQHYGGSGREKGTRRADKIEERRRGKEKPKDMDVETVVRENESNLGDLTRRTRESNIHHGRRTLENPA